MCADFLGLVRADLLLAQRYIVYARWFAVCDRWDEAAACRDKADNIYERLERRYETWLNQSDALQRAQYQAAAISG